MYIINRSIAIIRPKQFRRREPSY